METTLLSIHWWRNEKKCESIHWNSAQQEIGTDCCTDPDMDTSQAYDDVWKKPDSEVTYGMIASVWHSVEGKSTGMANSSEISPSWVWWGGDWLQSCMRNFWGFWQGSESWLWVWLLTVFCQNLEKCIGLLWWHSGSSESACNADTRDSGLISWLGRSPGGGNGNPVFFPGKSHGERSLAGYNLENLKESNATEWWCTHACIEQSIKTLKFHWVSKTWERPSLAVQWLRLCLPMQKVRV